MGVARTVVVGSPYNGVELAELDSVQTADTMYLAHIDHVPRKLVRQGHTAWEFLDVSFGPDLSAPTGLAVAATVPNTDAANGGNAYFPQSDTYVVTAVSDASGHESRASSEVSATNDLTLKRNFNSLTWSAVTGADRYNVYKAHNNQFFGYIGTTEDLAFKDDNVAPALDRAPPQAHNPFGAVGDYPSTVTLFEQRLFFGRTINAPNGVFGSRSGGSQFENFDRSRPLRADDSLSFSIVSNKVNAVEQLVATTTLLALTSDAIFTVDGDGGGGIITATSQAARRQIGRGSSRLEPLVIDNVVFYAPSAGRSVRTINYSFDMDGLQSNDVAIFSPHLFDGLSIVSWCYAQEPDSLIWAARSDGKLLCFTWEQEQNVWGWTLCETDGLVQSLCCIREGAEDRVYMIVERQIGGQARRFIERMASVRWTALADCCFLDCAVSGVFETPQTRFTGLWHLEGRTDVAGLVDGIPVRNLTVSGGAVVLPSGMPAATQATFGLPYSVAIETLPVRAQLGDGINVGRRQQPGEITLSLYRSSAVDVGVRADSLNPVKQRTGEAWGSPDNLMTGDYEINSGNVEQGKVCVHIAQQLPLPLTLLGAFVDPVVHG
jgi:hypothetical protein